MTGQYGQPSQRLNDFSRSYKPIYSLGPSIKQPIFQGGRIKANIALSEAQRNEAALSYQKTVLSVLRDVRMRSRPGVATNITRGSLTTATEANAADVDIARDRYQHGLSTYLEVLTPQNTPIQAQQPLIQAQPAVANDLVTLYKALGGGCQVPPVSD